MVDEKQDVMSLEELARDFINKDRIPTHEECMRDLARGDPLSGILSERLTGHMKRQDAWREKRDDVAVRCLAALCTIASDAPTSEEAAIGARIAFDLADAYMAERAKRAEVKP